MDTEKYIKLEHKVSMGKSPNDEGPYYHHAFWESYKGSIKGKLFGVVIGGLVGALIGGAVLTVAVITPALGISSIATGGTALGVMAAFTSAGLAYAMKEFGAVGRTVGGSAAQFYQQELREKTFIKGQVAEIKEELNEVKSLIKGEPIKKTPENQKIIAMANAEEDDYRKAHYARINPPNKLNSLAFWKVVILGLAVGATAGFLLGTGGVALEVLAHLGIEGLSAAGVTTTSTIVLGAMGASFGINRDFFRKIADKTDLLFKGRLKKEDHIAVSEDQLEAGKIVRKRLQKKAEKKEQENLFAENSGIDYPESNTHFRDKVLPAEQRALLGFDHTRATPQ